MDLGLLVDLGALAIILISIVLGVFRGVVREILNIIGLVAAFVLAILYYKEAYIQTEFDFWAGDKLFSHILWFVAIALGVWIIVKIINHLICKYIKKKKKLSRANRFFGLCFGLLKGAVVVSVIALVFVSIPLDWVGAEEDVKGEFGNSQLLALAKENTWVVSRIRESQTYEMFEDWIAARLAREFAEQLPTEDEELKEKGTEILKNIFKNPEVLKKLDSSKEARTVAEKFMKHPGFKTLIDNSETINKIKKQDEVSLEDIRDILTDEEIKNKAKELLKDEEFKKMCLEIDVEKIKEEVKSGE